MGRKDTAKRLTLTSLLTNGFLTAIKLVAGIWGNSSVVIADGIDSLSDMFTTLIAYIGVNLSEKEADENHQYGHERFEAILGKILAFFLFTVSVGLLIRAFDELRSPHNLVPSFIALIAAILSIIFKLALSLFTLREAKRIKSSVYEADAKNYLNDVLASVLALLGVFLAQRGYPIFQPIFTMVIAGFILKIAFELYRDSISDLSDRAADPKLQQEIQNKIMSHNEVKAIDVMRTRMHGKRVFVDIEIALDKSLSLCEAHNIAETIHDDIEKSFLDVKHIMVHINPFEEEKDG